MSEDGVAELWERIDSLRAELRRIESRGGDPESVRRIRHDLRALHRRVSLRVTAPSSSGTFYSWKKSLKR
jgi:hypothetical protein